MVPAIIHLAGSGNWWPGHVPEVTKDFKDIDDGSDERALSDGCCCIMNDCCMCSAAAVGGP